MPNTTNHPNQPSDREMEEARQLVQRALTAYLELNLHDARGGDPSVGLAMERNFQSQRQTVVHLVAAGLHHTDPPFL